MPSKRRNNGRNKKNRGHTTPVVCTNCARLVPKVLFSKIPSFIRYVIRTRPSSDSPSETSLMLQVKEILRKIWLWTVRTIHLQPISFLIMWFFYLDLVIPKLYTKLQYCVSCAIHARVVRVRSHEDRKNRAPPKRFQVI